MTEQETLKLIGLAMMCYPKWLENATKETLEPMKATWHRMLGDLEFEVAEAALAKHVGLSKFPPTIHEIREAAASLLPTSIPDAEEAWGEVWKAISKYGYTRPPESLKSPDPTQTFVVFSDPWDFSHPVIGQAAKAMWGSWTAACRECETETAGVQRGQFMRVYATVTRRQREAKLLPAPVRELTLMLAERLRAQTAASGPITAPAGLITGEAEEESA